MTEPTELTSTRGSYVLLKEESHDNGHVYHLVGIVTEAPNAVEAIRRNVADAGVYYAVPQRSWQPHTATVETQPRIRID